MTLKELTKLVARALQSPVAFRQWLEAQPEGKKLAEARNSCACPLVRWLESLSPELEVIVNKRFVKVRPFGGVCAFRTLDLPQWAFLFVEELDCGRSYGAPVTRTECLAALQTA